MATARVAVHVLAAVVIACAAQSQAQVTLPSGLPSYCGGTLQARDGDTCATLADFSGLSLAKWKTLNPSVDCSSPIKAESQVCIGDKLSFCNNLYFANAGDTCKSIDTNLGRIISGEDGAACKDPITKNTALCIADSANECASSKIGGVPISEGLQNLFGGLPDFCTLIKASNAKLTPLKLSGTDSLQLTLSDITPAVKSILGNAGHSELNAFQKQLRVKNVDSLIYTFIPGNSPGKEDIAAFSFERPGGGNRKLLSRRYWGGTRIAHCYSYLRYLYN